MTATQQIQVTLNGTTQTIDVSLANLSSDLNLKDFVVIVGGNIVANTNYTKTNQTTITYSGPSLTSQSTIIRRRTPASQLYAINYTKRVSSADWQKEVDRLYRRLVEVEAFGYNYLGGFIGAGNSVINNQPYGVSWSTDTEGTASRKAIYDKFVLVDNSIGALNSALNTTNTNLSSLSVTVNNQATTLSGLSTSLNATSLTAGNALARVGALETTNFGRVRVVARRVPVSPATTNDQSLSSGVPTTIIFNDELFDTGTYHNPVTGDIAPNVSASHLLNFNASFTTGGTMPFFNEVRLLNVTDNTFQVLGYAYGSGNAAVANIVTTVELLNTKTYRLQVTISGVTPVMVCSNNVVPRLTMIQVSV